MNSFVLRSLIILLLFGLFVQFAVSPPPKPHNVKGTVYHFNGSGVENGIPVLINDTILNTSATTEVFAPPVSPGAYSTTIIGANGDTVIATAWNATHFGTNSTTLQGTTTIDITLNTTRTPEPNVTIVAPPDNSTYNGSEMFNVSVNVTVLGADGDCNVTISFGNPAVLNVSAGESTTHVLGSITRGTTVQTNFSVEGFALGFSSVTAVGICTPEGPMLEATTTDTLQNITIVDNAPPDTVLVHPINNTLNKTSQTINFTYVVTDFLSVLNCSLILNNVLNETNTSVTKNINQSFVLTLPNGNYNWSVNCTDNQGNVGASNTYNLTVEFYPPNLTTTIIDSIVLNAGTTKFVECNLSATDQDGAANIVSANATFYYELNTSDDPDDPNVHYTNSSCSQIGAFGNQKNFTCSFNPWFFALNGTWFCNGTVLDAEGLIDSDENDTVIDPLFALNVTETLMFFGDVEAGFVSANITQNVSNLGNNPINVTVWGYGASGGDGNAFSCGVSNVSVDNMRFAPNSTAPFTEKELLDSSPKQARLTINKQTQIDVGVENSTYWQVFIPKNTSDVGYCNGTLVFQAELS